MTRYLLDTTVLIDLSKGVASVQHRLRAMIAGGDELGVCAISVAEFFAGLEPAERPRWDRFLRTLRYWDITPDMAIRAGIDRYTLARQGRAISTQDSLIAAVAVAVGAILITDNQRHFSELTVQTISLRA